MTDKVTVQARRPFDNGDELKDENSKPFQVTRQRFAELRANGLVEAIDGETSGEEPSDADKAVASAGTRVAAANEAAETAIADHEARVGRAREEADRAIAGHEARVAEAKTRAEEAIATEERRVTEAVQKQGEQPENKNGANPQNKAAQTPANKAK